MNDIEQARQAGRRAFARGDNGNSNVYQDMARAFDEGYDEARGRNTIRLDMSGHPAALPHVCPGDPIKVCACCARCSAPCRPSVGNVLRTLASDIYSIVRRAP